MNRRILFATVFVLSLIGDQLVKVWARGAMNVGGSVDGLPWPGVFEVTLSYNKGVAFGMLQGFGVLLAPVAIVIAFIAWRHSWRNPNEGRWIHIALALLASGALGNLYDRLFHHQVTDMFSFKLINFPIFNVADACITVAAGMLILRWLKEPKDNAKPASLETPAEDLRS